MNCESIKEVFQSSLIVVNNMNTYIYINRMRNFNIHILAWIRFVSILEDCILSGSFSPMRFIGQDRNFLFLFCFLLFSSRGARTDLSGYVELRAPSSCSWWEQGRYGGSRTEVFALSQSCDHHGMPVSWFTRVKYDQDNDEKITAGLFHVGWDIMLAVLQLSEEVWVEPVSRDYV